MVAQALLDQEFTGYSEADIYLGTRYLQGNRQVFGIDLGLGQVTNLVREPNPDKPTEDNRVIDLPHALAFADYLRTNPDAVIPSLFLRAPSGVFKFEELKQVGGTAWGILSVPKTAREAIRIIDGQHRVLGMHRAIQAISEELSKARSRRAVAQKEQDSAQYNYWADQVSMLEMQNQRFAKERVAVHIVIVDDEAEYRQIFVDIASNARGINQSVRVRLDSRRIVNRAVAKVAEHPLMAGRVDPERDRILADNPNLLGLKHLADIARTLQVGVAGRITVKKEDELSEQKIIDDSWVFLDALVLGFDKMEQIVSGTLLSADLRKNSLLGSATMLRVLADVYRNIGDHSLAAAFFKGLAPLMSAPITQRSRWLESSAMKVGAMAPTARMGDQKNLSDTILKWYKQSAAPQAKPH